MTGVLGSSGELPKFVSEADVVIISVRDSRVREVAERLVSEKRLRPTQILLHTSGALAAGEVLAVAKTAVKGIGTLHPLIAVTDAPGTLENVRGATFGIEGDEPARKAARRLAESMGGRSLELSAAAMATYHAAAVVASNYVVALADVARSLLISAGVSESDALPAILPLMGSAVRNLAEVGLPAAMTGPLVRGDVASIERHCAALAKSAPGLLDLYQRLGQEALRVARQRTPGLDADAVEKMAVLLGGGGAATSARSRAPVKVPASRKGR